MKKNSVYMQVVNAMFYYLLAGRHKGNGDWKFMPTNMTT
jgi:hypothetical protein